MSTYAIGDIHGCFETLQALLRRIGYDPSRDRLWCVGDLVSRGPKSLEVLNWALAQGPQLVAVMGNHDLNLLACAAGIRQPRARDKFGPIFAASDRDKLFGWLGHRPLLFREGKWCLVHAGLLPHWTLGTADRLAAELHAQLCEETTRRVLLSDWWGTRTGEVDPDRAENALTALDAFTRLRMFTAEGQIAHEFTGPPEQAPAGYRTWFDLPHKRPSHTTVICGHWASLGLRMRPDLIALDSGCSWGDRLTAIRLKDLEVFQQPNCEGSAP